MTISTSAPRPPVDISLAPTRPRDQAGGRMDGAMPAVIENKSKARVGVEH